MDLRDLQAGDGFSSLKVLEQWWQEFSQCCFFLTSPGRVSAAGYRSKNSDLPSGGLPELQMTRWMRMDLSKKA